MKKNYFTFFTVVFAIFLTQSLFAQKNLNFSFDKIENSKLQLFQSKLVEKNHQVTNIFSSTNVIPKAPSAVTVAVPYLEDFESYSASKNTLAAFGYTVISGGKGADFNVGYLSTQSGAILGNSGSYYITSNYDSSNPRNEWVITPGIELTAGVQYTFSVYARVPGYGGNLDEFKIAYGTSATVAGLTTVLIDKTGTNAVETTDWTRYAAHFTPTTTGTYYFGINHCTSALDVNGVGFDDVSVTERLAYEIVSGINYVPTPSYTLAPQFLAQTTTDSIYVYHINKGASSLTNVTSTITVTKDGTEDFREVVGHSLLTAEDTVIVKTAAPYSIPFSNTTASTYTYSASVTTTELSTPVALTPVTVTGPVYSTNVYARDNDDIQNGYGYPGGSFGQLFNFPVQTTIKSISFKVFGVTAAQTSFITIYRLADGTLTEVAYSNDIQLAQNDNTVEYTTTLSSGDFTLSPGNYIVSLYNPAGTAKMYLGVGSNTNYGASYAYVPNLTSGWTLLTEKPYAIRLNVADPNTASDEQISANSNISIFNSNNTIQINKVDSDAVVSVYSVSGQEVMTEKVSSGNNTLNHNLSKGIYIVKIGNTVAKVTVQ